MILDRPGEGTTRERGKGSNTFKKLSVVPFLTNSVSLNFDGFGSIEGFHTLWG